MSWGDKPFKTDEQVQAMEDDMREFFCAYPEGAAMIKSVWRKHLMEVGHKAMGRLVLAFEPPRPVVVASKEQVEQDKRDLYPKE